jgi:hypothetical protein
MGGPHRSNMALVERRDLRLAQALGERHEAGIDDSEREIGRASLQLAAAGKIGAGRRFDAIDPREQVVEEDEPGVGRQPAAAPVVELGQDEGRDDQILVCVGQESGAALMIGIGGVERSQQRTGVADERHRQRGSSATGSAVTSAALRPSVERATPTRGRRRVRSSCAFSSTASRRRVARGTPRRCASASSVRMAAGGALTVVRRS